MKKMEIEKVKGCNSKINTFTTIASGTVIIEGDKVLLAKEVGDPFWKFPGGCIRDHENFRQVAIRETKEETGLEVKIENNAEPKLFSFHKDSEEGVIYITLVHYLAKSYSGELQLDTNRGIERLHFYKITELPNDTAPNIQPILKEFGFYNG